MDENFGDTCGQRHAWRGSDATYQRKIAPGEWIQGVLDPRSNVLKSNHVNSDPDPDELCDSTAKPAPSHLSPARPKNLDYFSNELKTLRCHCEQ